MSKTWFRLYTEFAYDPKIQSLSEALQRRYVILLCMKSNGDFENLSLRNGNVTLKIISSALRITEDETKETLKIFNDYGLIDDELNINGWEKRQYISDLKDPTNSKRQKRYRDKKRNGSNEKSNAESNGTVTVKKRPDTDTDTDINNKKKYIKKSDSVSRKPTRYTLEEFNTFDLSGWPEIPSDQIITDWLKVRHGKKAPLSQTVINAIGKQLQLASSSGFTAQECLETAVQRNWQGFQADWMNNNRGGFSGKSNSSNEPFTLDNNDIDW